MSDEAAANALFSSQLLTDEDLERLARESGSINPFDERMLSGCSYDLRMGAVLRSRNRARVIRLEEGEYSIESGECVSFETLEVLDFRSPLLFGFVINKHSVLARGLFHPITKVDPGFHGPLAITMFNLGNIPETVRYKEPVVSLVLVPVSSPPKRVYGTSQRPSYREGSLDVASVVNEPAGDLEDSVLARMYGRPVSRLYEIVTDLQRSIDAGLIVQSRDARARWVDIAWRFGAALTGAIVALGGKYLIDHLGK